MKHAVTNTQHCDKMASFGTSKEPAPTIAGYAQFAPTIGLREDFLRKHLRERFYGFLDNKNFNSDAAAKFKQRFERNRDKLFTFLSLRRCSLEQQQCRARHQGVRATSRGHCRIVDKEGR